MNKNKIEIYTTKNCPYCIKAKKLLSLLNLEFSEQNIEDCFEAVCLELSKKYNKPGISTVPQIIINNNYIGGYDDLEKVYKNNELKNILN